MNLRVGMKRAGLSKLRFREARIVTQANDRPNQNGHGAKNRSSCIH